MTSLHLSLLLVGTVGSMAALYLALLHPRWLVYLLFSSLLSQFIFVPVQTFYLSPADVLVVAGMTGLVVRALAGMPAAWSSLYRHRYFLLLLLTYGIGFVAYGYFTITVVRTLLGAAPALLACEALRTRAHLSRMAQLLVISGLGWLGVGIGLYALGLAPDDSYRFAIITNPNFTGVYLATIAMVAFGRCCGSVSSVRLAAPMTFVLFTLTTLSHGAALAIAAGWLIAARRAMSFVAKLYFIGGGCAVLGVVFFIPDLTEALATRNERNVMADGIERNSFDIRRMVLNKSWQVFLDHPVIGVGYCRFLEYSNTDDEIYYSHRGEGLHTHNTYLEVLVEGGILAFLCLAMHLKGCLTDARCLWRRANHRDPMAIAYLGAFAISLASALTINLMLNYVFWGGIGLCMAAAQCMRREMLPGHLPAGVSGSAVPPPKLRRAVGQNPPTAHAVIDRSTSG